MISELVTLISLNLTAALLNAGHVAGTLPITDASVTTPIAVTSPAHGVPLGRVVHAGIAGVTGEVEANGLWILTPTDSDTFALSSLDGNGNRVPSVGAHAYSGGGVISYALSDWGILLGRRFVALSSAVVSPRIVFVPTDGAAWGLEPYGGGNPVPSPPPRGSPEAQAEKLLPQLATQFTTFDVYVTGAASPPSPDFGDFDACQALVYALYSVMHSTIGGPRIKVLAETWPSQTASAGSQSQRGQQWKGRVQFQQPVVREPLQYVPEGTSLVLSVYPLHPASGDTTVIDIG